MEVAGTIDIKENSNVKRGRWQNSPKCMILSIQAILHLFPDIVVYVSCDDLFLLLLILGLPIRSSKNSKHQRKQEIFQPLPWLELQLL